MWGIIPAAGMGTRIQPLAFSKELLPIGCCFDTGEERPRAVSEFLVERLIRGGADKICFVISPGKADILQYFGGSSYSAHLSYVVQEHPAGLCDAIFAALPLIAPNEVVAIGLPDTIWFPADAFGMLPKDVFSFLLFPVEKPEQFDAVITDAHENVIEVRVKQPGVDCRWVWGAFQMPGRTLAELHALWLRRQRRDEYIGTLVNAWISEGGAAKGIRAGTAYVDVGTLNGYRQAMQLLQAVPPGPQLMSRASAR
jgi:glucose-1-phosphate thymidylyltransferase